jgi:hypothetical protein
MFDELSTTPWRRMRSGGIAPPFLTSALDGGEWSVLITGRLAPGDKDPGTHWMGGWVGFRDGLGAAE